MSLRSPPNSTPSGGGSTGVGTNGLTTPRIPYATNASTLADSDLTRFAADITAQIGQTTTNPQSFRVYNTADSATAPTNSEFIGLGYSANVARLSTNKTGTGVARPLSLQAGTSAICYLGSNATDWWQINLAGSLMPVTNGVPDIGSGTLGIKRLYVDYTNTATVGSVAINKAGGKVNMAALGSSLTLTNSLITVNSRLILQIASNPGNAVAVCLYYVPSAGSAIITAIPAVTNQTIIDFTLINAD